MDPYFTPFYNLAHLVAEIHKDPKLRDNDVPSLKRTASSPLKIGWKSSQKEAKIVFQPLPTAVSFGMRVCFINFTPYQWTRPYLPSLAYFFRCVCWLFVSGEGRVPNLGYRSHWIPGKPMVAQLQGTKPLRSQSFNVANLRHARSGLIRHGRLSRGTERQRNGKRTFPRKGDISG